MSSMKSIEAKPLTPTQAQKCTCASAAMTLIGGHWQRPLTRPLQMPNDAGSEVTALIGLEKEKMIPLCLSLSGHAGISRIGCKTANHGYYKTKTCS